MDIENYKKLNEKQIKLLRVLYSEYIVKEVINWDSIIELDLFHYTFIDVCANVAQWLHNEFERGIFYGSWDPESNVDTILKTIETKYFDMSTSEFHTKKKYAHFFYEVKLGDYRKLF